MWLIIQPCTPTTPSTSSTSTCSPVPAVPVPDRYLSSTSSGKYPQLGTPYCPTPITSLAPHINTIRILLWESLKRITWWILHYTRITNNWFYSLRVIITTSIQIPNDTTIQMHCTTAFGLILSRRTNTSAGTLYTAI